MKGDTERQASLRNEMIKRERVKRSDYVLKISAVIKPGMKLLDVGCGTAHIIGDLAAHHKNAIFVGLDVSPATLKIAKLFTMRLPNVILVEGDGLKLPFQGCSFDVVITRLVEHSPQEVYRVLKRGGFFFEYNLVQRPTKRLQNSSREELKKKDSSFPIILESGRKKCVKRLRVPAF